MQMSRNAHPPQHTGDSIMNTPTKIILATALVALLSAPASARLVNDGGLSAYPQFGQEHVKVSRPATPGIFINRPTTR